MVYAKRGIERKCREMGRSDFSIHCVFSVGSRNGGRQRRSATVDERGVFRATDAILVSSLKLVLASGVRRKRGALRTWSTLIRTAQLSTVIKYHPGTINVISQLE